MKNLIIILCTSLLSLASSSAEDANISLTQWKGPMMLTVTSEVELAGQKMQMSVDYMICTTTAIVVSKSKEKQTFILAVDDPTLKALKALTPELKGFDPYLSFSVIDRVLPDKTTERTSLPDKTIELAEGEQKSICVQVGIHATAYGKLNAEKQKTFQELCQNAKVTIRKKDK